MEWTYKRSYGSVVVMVVTGKLYRDLENTLWNYKSLGFMKINIEIYHQGQF